MTQIKKIQDLLYFKVKLQPDNINLELVNKEKFNDVGIISLKIKFIIIKIDINTYNIQKI